MAKQSVIQLVIDDQGQLQKLLQNTQNLSKIVNNINQSFQGITVQVQNINQQNQVTVNMFQQMLTGSNNVLSAVNKVTHNLGKWVTLISGTVMMLGSGAGLWGIDRFINQMVQRQRTAAGQGLTYGQGAANQAGALFSPGSDQLAKNISLAKGGNIQARVAMRQLGVSWEGDNLDIQKNIYRALIREGARNPNFPVLAEQTGLDKFVGQENILASQTPEGRHQLGYAMKAIDVIKSVKQPTQDELDKVDDLKLAFLKFTTTVNTFMVRILAKFSGPGQGMSNAASNVFSGDSSPATTGAWNKAAHYLGWGLGGPLLGSWVDSKMNEEAQKKMKDVGDTITKNVTAPTEDFDKTMKDLDKNTGRVVDKITTLLDNVFGSPDGTPGSVDSPPSPGSRSAPSTSGPGPSTGPSPGPSTGPGPAPAPTSPPPSVPLTPPPRSGPWLSPLGPPSVGPKFGPLPGFVPGSSLPPGKTWVPNMPGLHPGTAPGTPQAPGIGGYGFPMENPSLLNPKPMSSINNRNQFAMNRMAPGGGNMFEKLSQHLVSRMTAEGGPMARRDGPLDVDQWQMGRTASIVVRNDHPSVQMSMAGMGMS